METYQTTSNEENGDGDVLQILRTEFLAGIAKMFEEDVGRSISEDESTLNEFRSGSPFLRALLGTNVPRLCILSATGHCGFNGV